MAAVPTVVKPRTPNRTSTAGATTRRPRRRVVESILIFVGCVLLIDAVFGERGLVALSRAEAEHQRLLAQLAAVEARGTRLRQEVQWLRYSPDAIEYLARQRLGLIKPGEKLFMIRDVPAVGEPAP